MLGEENVERMAANAPAEAPASERVWPSFDLELLEMSHSVSRLNKDLDRGYAAPQPTPAGSRPTLDLVHLARQSLGDKDREIEILALFDQQSGQALARLEALSGRDGAVAADLARMLAASARIAGAFAVASAATVYEAVVLSSGEGDAGAEALDHLRAEVTQVREAIGSLLAR
jgi:HPt (histidine-containing phosphotransfer) domain-containing protein